MNDFILCEACARHVRRDEDRCPFCAAAIAAATREASPRVAPRGLSRARLYAFHAVVTTGVAAGMACGGSTTTSLGGDASSDSASGGDGANGGDGSNSVDANGVDANAADANGSDALADGTTGDDAADGAADAGIDRGLPPPPYGCVFPGGCDDVFV